MKFLAVLLVSLSLACAGSNVELDPRDQEAVDRITKVSSSVLMKVNSGYFGTVRVSIVGESGGMAWKLGSAPNGETDLSFKRGQFGSGNISILLEPLGAGGKVYRALDLAPAFGEYRFLLEGIWLAPNTEVVFLNITNVLNQSSASWY
jgi:hypothetical protein